MITAHFNHLRIYLSLPARALPIILCRSRHLLSKSLSNVLKGKLKGTAVSHSKSLRNVAYSRRENIEAGFLPLRFRKATLTFRTQSNTNIGPQKSAQMCVRAV
ncbi:hypothetical protein IRJ41_008335 [Triplophysa rosa]|uniref:Uncharacterized protein n=1 Tax=Triplophysa rosa TaxID=992332 RepID=A0A9W7WSU3_TRIRA|nr:hypothetical protein IRJ41_008335 [Triplophysa rosa]